VPVLPRVSVSLAAAGSLCLSLGGVALSAPTTVSFPVPVAASIENSPAVSDTLVAYADPLPRGRAARGRPAPPASERLVGYSLRATAAGIVVAPPQALCTVTGSPDLAVAPWSTRGRWVVYSAYAYNVPTTWTLAMCQVGTGRRVVLDTSARERGGDDAAQARSDGRVVVWSSMTRAPGQRAPTSVVRAYDLVTGRRWVVVQGGTPGTFGYGDASVSGRRILFEKQAYVGTETTQFLLADVETGQVRPLFPPQHDAYGATLSGDIVAWGVGGPTANGGRGGVGVGVYNLRTGARAEFAATFVTAQQAVAGHDVVYSSGAPPNGDATTLWLYDARTGRQTALVRPHPPQNYGAGSEVLTGGHAVLYQRLRGKKEVTPTTAYAVVTLLP